MIKSQITMEGVGVTNGIIDKDKEALSYVVYNVTDNISSQARELLVPFLHLSQALV